MLKNHDFGLDSSRVRALRAFLWATVPLRAAVIDSDGDLVPIDGGTKRRRGCWRAGRLRVGDLPAAGGAESGVMVVEEVSRRGVAGTTLGPCSGGRIDKLWRAGFDLAKETSSSKMALLRFRSKDLGSTFSLSEFSGEAARRLRDGLRELGVMIAFER